MLTSFADDEALVDSVIAGAQGYVLEAGASGRTWSRASGRVAAGGSLLAPDVEAKVRARLRAGPEEDDRLAGADARERTILALLADGLTNREIGDADVPVGEDGQELHVERAAKPSACTGGPRRRCSRPRSPAAARDRDLRP